MLLDPVDFTEELMGAEELVTAARTLRRCVFVQTPAVLRHTTAHPNLNIAVAINVITSKTDVERPRVTHRNVM